MHDIIVIGGGAAGVFAAITAKAHFPHARIALVEKSAQLLSKVRISGGGRCNVTHSCFDPKLLVQHYPRGSKELLGAFYRFQPSDTISWFAQRGVELHTESDGRIFPTTNCSDTIIQALVKELALLEIDCLFRQQIEEIESITRGYQIHRREAEPLLTSRLILATGSNPTGYSWAKALGHTITAPVPSLFTFNIPTSPLKELSGIAIDPVQVTLPGRGLSYTGALLITHFGFSGPAILKLSAWGARYLAEQNYQTELRVNWLPAHPPSHTRETLLSLKKALPHKLSGSENPFPLPKSLWKALLGPLACKRLSDISLKEIELFIQTLHGSSYQIEGKTTHKEEFVTCGGVNLQEVDFKTMQSRCAPGLFFAGELLDIDGITGGFNFQNAWTTGFIAGSSVFR